MAKGKHAAALFEVIHSGKSVHTKEDKAGLLRTPKWWFKSKKREEVSSPPPPAAVASAPVQGEPSTRVSANAFAPVLDPTSVTAPAPSQPGIDLKLDPDRQQITFRVSYTSAIVTGFAVVVVVALAYMIGRSMSRGPSPALAGPSTEQVRQGPARPDVYNLTGNAGSQRRAETREPDDGIASVPAQSRNAATNLTPPVASASNPPAPQLPAKRTLNLNYVIVQSYPDESSAINAVRILADNGVPATVERGLRGYGSSWYTVVAMEGFPRARGPEYEAHVKQIQQISDKFVGSKKSFKAFQPLPYKWDRP